MTHPLHHELALDREQQCIGRAQAGDVEALGELYDLHAARLYQCVIYPVVGEAAAAEDVLAETFRAAYAKLPEFRSQGVSVYFWLATIARNKSRDVHRRRKAQGKALRGFADLLLPLLEAGSSPEQQLSEAVSHEALTRRVQATLAQLNDRYRMAIELRFFEELPRPACAERLEVQLGTFDVLLLRALRAFRKHWTQLGDELPAALEAQGE